MLKCSKKVGKVKNEEENNLIISIVMLLGAIVFIIFALNNPQASFPWSNTITYGIYIIYVIATVFLLVKGLLKGN